MIIRLLCGCGNENDDARRVSVGVKVPLIIFSVRYISDYVLISLNGIKNQETHVEALRLVQKYFDGSCTDQYMK